MRFRGRARDGTTIGAEFAVRRAPGHSVQLATLLFATYALLGATCLRTTVRSVQVDGTFNQPIFVTAPIGDPRLFVVERAGAIRVLDEYDNVVAKALLASSPPHHHA